MEPAVGVLLLSLLFAGTHIGLASRRPRTALVARLGEPGFDVVFFLVAAASFTALVRFYALHRFEGAPGLALGAVPAVRWVLVAAVVLGVTLAVAGVAVYSRWPMTPFAPHVCAPRGLERITRHPFFVGMALLGGSHALLASRLVGTVAFAGLALLAVAGAWHQDRKLARQRGSSYVEYLGVTSAVPFGAILAGRQRLVWRELPLGGLATGVAVAFALRAVHPTILGDGGAWVIGFTVGSAFLLMLDAWRRTRRVRVPAPLPRSA
jgi:uncharacterized membrane protein